VRRLMEIGNPGTLSHEAGYVRRYVELADGCEDEVNSLRFRGLRVNHGGGQMESFGLRVTTGGRRLAYTGDTGWCEALTALGEDAEVFVTDCTYPDGR